MNATTTHQSVWKALPPSPSPSTYYFCLQAKWIYCKCNLIPLAHHSHAKETMSEILLMDYSSVFSTIVPLRYFPILRNLGLNVELCSWMFDLPTSTTGDAVCPVTLLSTLEPLKDGFWAPSCTHSAPLSVWPYQLLCHHHGTGFHLLSA